MDETWKWMRRVRECQPGEEKELPNLVSRNVKKMLWQSEPSVQIEWPSVPRSVNNSKPTCNGRCP